MSIFKESFKDFIKLQIEKRQEKVSKGDRGYFLARQCTIRMASGVNVNGTSDSAKANVLQGGTLTPNLFTRKGYKNTTDKDGNAITLGAYNDPANGFGRVPMAGITSVQIKTKSAYGSLRHATVNFECHNTDQLSTLEKLYMRPGYPCLLEWGWEPYINNKGERKEKLGYISSEDKFWGKNLNNEKYNQETLQSRIIEKKEEYKGNYDGLYGIVKDFNYSVRPDGGYTCRTELISIGEVLESLTGTLSDEDNTKSHLEKTLENLSEYASALRVSPVSDEELDEFVEQVQSGSIQLPTEYRKKIIIGKGNSYGGTELKPYGGEIENYGKTWTWKEQRTDKQIQEDIKELRYQKIEEFENNYPELLKTLIKYEFAGGSDPIPSIWIPWGDLITIINNSIPRDTANQPIIEIAPKNDDLDFNENFINGEFFIWAQDYVNKIFTGLSNGNGTDILYNWGGGLGSSNLSISVNPNICLFPENLKQLGLKTFSTKNERRIRNICFEVTYLVNTFKSLYYEKGDFGEQVVDEKFSIGKFIKKIWDDVNSSCGNTHNFNIINDFEKGHKIKVIDLNFTGENLTSNSLATLNVLNTKSIVRDFNYDLSVPSSLTATIAIAAQNPDDPEAVNQVTFAAFNKGVKNRFASPKNNGSFWNDNRKSGWYSNATYSTAEKKFFRFAELKIALDVYLDRLKNQPRVIRSNDPTKLDLVIETLLPSDKLVAAQTYNEKVESDQSKIKLVGDMYQDFTEIPGSDLSSAQSALRYIKAASIDLARLSIPGSNNRFIGSPIKKNPDFSSIIPLKFNAQLDGIGGIVIGNVFKIDQSRLPALYKDNKVVFVVLGEQQNITGQDWTTTITGQATMLPI